MRQSVLIACWSASERPYSMLECVRASLEHVGVRDGALTGFVMTVTRFLVADGDVVLASAGTKPEHHLWRTVNSVNKE